ncbi:MAG: hypothetical protein ACR2NL_03320 [Acidimicrobiia bacterium]
MRTTTSAPTGPAEGGFVVANTDGAFLIDDGFLFQMVEGPVELALDDGAGGLVFQRPPNAGPPDPRATIIYYLPADSLAPQELLVPTGEQYLKLRDVSEGAVWYTRNEGDTPDTSRETLRTFNLTTRTVDQFAITGGWESGALEVSAAGSTVVAYWSSEASFGFTFFAESGGLVGFEGNPYGADLFCGDGDMYDTNGNFVRAACFEYAELSDDGRLAFLERAFDGVQVRYVLIIVDLDSGEELFRQDLQRPDQGWLPKTIDLLGNQAIVNRSESGLYRAPFVEALLVDLDTGVVSELGVAGNARFLKGPIAID